MKKATIFFLLFIFSIFVIFSRNLNVYSQNNPSNQQNQRLPTPTIPVAHGCPTELEGVYQLKNQSRAAQGIAEIEKCTTNYQEFLSNPYLYHFWTRDEEVTIEGKAKERARQFIYWVMNNPGIDNHPVLFKIWSSARNIAYLLTLVIAAVLGLLIIINQRTNYDTGVRVLPSTIKIFLSLLFITFSATIVVSIIQLSEILMKFFIENLGGKDLFNIYFKGKSVEENYSDFYGIKDLNIPAQEAVRTQLFVLKITEISYYFLGIMIILRKIILWFLLFVSPFLPILLVLNFAKNVGLIWIGVFFQWVFYGPLLALFLGAMAQIWQAGIPFPFDFSRVGTAIGYVYPTATNILWGGPAQNLSELNNANYVDTFAEYIISIVFIWTAAIFPWWLLRSFRDYCCEGINSIKNLLLSKLNSLYQQIPPGPTLPPSPPSLKTPILTTKTSFDYVPSSVKSSVEEKVTRLETFEEIKKTKTEEIASVLQVKATSLKEISNFEIRKEKIKEIGYLKNPAQITDKRERQMFMNIRLELSKRAFSQDELAQRIISSISYSPSQRIKYQARILSSLPKLISLSQLVSQKVKITPHYVEKISASSFNYFLSNPNNLTKISNSLGITSDNVRKVFEVFSRNIDRSPKEILSKLIQETNLEKEKIRSVLEEYIKTIKSSLKFLEDTANNLNVQPNQLKKILETQVDLITQADNNINEAISLPEVDTYQREEAFPLIESLSYRLKIPPQTLNQLSFSSISYFLSNPNNLTKISNSLGITSDNVRKVFEVFSRNIDRSPKEILSKLIQETNLEKEKIRSVLEEYIKSLNEDQEFIDKTTTALNIKPEEVKQSVSELTRTVAEPEKAIVEKETSVSPKSGLIDEYEQVKKMWQDQYEKGEIPQIENIFSRTDWVEKEIIKITNTLNKLYSDNEQLKQEGLEEVGYILPLFIINNLDGEKLVVYLKAKLEAAKTVKNLLEKEKEITEKLKAKTEKVQVLRRQKEEQKQKEMSIEEEGKN
ncbi:MAG: hypothetical protein NZL96_03495 [Patescibacteria group bacterium]|nr:hypothetical protein [Patescibacteria group bacterium]